MKVLELFSGLGGMRFSFLYAGMDLKFHPIDISDSANQTYERTFKEKVKQLDICTLDEKFFKENEFDVWTMSPPCQPYTRQRDAKCREGADNRSSALSHLIFMLSSLENILLPKVLVLENVRHFAGSAACMDLSCVLIKRGFKVRAFVTSPRQIGFPNERTRFYLIAKRVDDDISMNDDEIEEIVRQISIETSILSAENTNESYYIPSFSSFLVEEMNKNENPNGLLIKNEVLKKPSTFCVDLVWKDETTSTCCELAPRKVNTFNSTLNVELPTLGAAADHKQAENLKKKLLSEESKDLADLTTEPSKRPEDISYISPPVKKVKSVEQDETEEDNQKDFKNDPSYMTDVRKKYALCFTKAYGRFFDGTGSCLVTHGKYSMLEEPKTDEEKNKMDEIGPLWQLTGRLRYFHPLEVARLMGFKDSHVGGNCLTNSESERHVCLPVSNTHLCYLHHNDSLLNTPKTGIHSRPCFCFKYHLSLPSIHLSENSQLKGRGGRQGDLSFRSYWALLGNSLNPQMVGKLLEITEVREFLDKFN
eukprot:GDKJ01027533.1.p1 GENE.GDKJ01027533.1~~GDKJ01027533.1.p1  ORF type:complete len:535 (-),score=102.63 GDKJ01027533.1:29-1633(-)